MENHQQIKKKIERFSDLEAWKQGHGVVLAVYRLTQKFPKDEIFGITNQMRRAAVSITSNIAEGFSRQFPKEKTQFYSVAQGSLTELQNQLLISRDVGYISTMQYQNVEEQTIFAHKLITGLIKYSKHATFSLILPFILLPLYFLLFVPSASAAISKPPNNLGLVAYYSFEDCRGATSTDFSGQGNTGTLTNFALSGSTSNWVTAGKRGCALNFDGAGDYVDISVPLTNSFTVSMWMNPQQQSNDYGTLVAESNIRGIYYRGSSAGVNAGKVTFYYGGDHHNNTAIAQNAWSHLVVVNDAGSVTFYVDGVSDGTYSSMPAMTAEFIGYDNNAVEAFKGSLDDVRIYNRALSPTEITALYGSGAAKINASTAGRGGSLTSGLVGHWTFDGQYLSTTTATDSGSGGNNGTLTGGPVPALGKTGQALSFDGVDDYAEVADSSSLDSTANSSYSYGMWLKTTTSNNVVLMEKGANGYMMLQPQSASALYINTSDSVAGGWTGFRDGLWHHIFVVYDIVANTATLYKDGTSIAVVTSAGAGTANNSPLHIGSRAGAYPIPASIDDVRIYNRALSATEVTALYGSGAARINASTAGRGNTSGLVGHWTFDGQYLNTTTSTDTSGQGNNGTLTGGPVPALGKLGQALSFDGVNDWVSIPSSSVFGPPQMTVSFWTKNNVTPNPGTSDAMLVREPAGSWNSGWGFWYSTTSQIAFWMNSYNTTPATATIAPTQWNHVVGTWNGTTIRLYVNGVEGTSGTYTGSQTGTTNPLTIGTGGTTSYNINGSMDDVRIYNRVLTATEINALYNLGR
jgi:four helix bundle protein